MSNSDVDPLYQLAARLVRFILVVTDGCRFVVWGGTMVHGK